MKVSVGSVVLYFCFEMVEEVVMVMEEEVVMEVEDVEEELSEGYIDEVTVVLRIQ
jgi:uncharacterized cupin superfamily protein